LTQNDVLEASRTKWNLFSFKPGLVGGHCIGVDPYYLAQKAQKMGIILDLIFSRKKKNNDVLGGNILAFKL